PGETVEERGGPRQVVQISLERRALLEPAPGHREMALVDIDHGQVPEQGGDGSLVVPPPLRHEALLVAGPRLGQIALGVRNVPEASDCPHDAELDLCLPGYLQRLLEEAAGGGVVLLLERDESEVVERAADTDARRPRDLQALRDQGPSGREVATLTCEMPQITQHASELTGI